VLDVGAGSGYFTSVCYHLVRSSAQQQGGGGSSNSSSGTVVVGIEHIPALTALAERNIRADGLGSAIDNEQGIVLVTGDGRLGAFFSPSFLAPFPP
jgi:protein-L-isoaspartate O-methyltransferase